MCYPVCGMVYIKEPLQLIGKSSPCGGSGFPFSLSEWSFTICLMPYKCNVLSASLNKTFPSFLPYYYVIIYISGNPIFTYYHKELSTSTFESSGHKNQFDGIPWICASLF